MGSQPWGLVAIASKPDVERPVWAKRCLPRSWLRRPLKRSVARGSYPGRTPRTRSPHSGAWHDFDALQKKAVFLELAPQLGFHELLMSQRGPQHNNPLLVIWEHVVATPHDHGRSHHPARLEDVLATRWQVTSPVEQLRFAQVDADSRVIPQSAFQLRVKCCDVMRVRHHPDVVKNAKSFSEGSKIACTATRALC